MEHRKTVPLQAAELAADIMKSRVSNTKYENGKEIAKEYKEIFAGIYSSLVNPAPKEP